MELKATIIYVVELINPIIKFRMFLSERNTMYRILEIHDIRVNQDKFIIMVIVIHAIIIEPKNNELNIFMLLLFIFKK